jgi:hypothetical protein
VTDGVPKKKSIKKASKKFCERANAQPHVQLPGVRVRDQPRPVVADGEQSAASRFPALS